MQGEHCLCIEEALGVGTHGAILLSSELAKYVHSLEKYELHIYLKTCCIMCRSAGMFLKSSGRRSSRNQEFRKPQVPIDYKIEWKKGDNSLN